MFSSNSTLLELERTEINRLFDKTEINYIFKQRKQYESGNIRKLVKKTHHLRYVGLEMEILKLISFRTHLLKDNYLKLEMGRGIVERIATLFKLVTSHFRNDHRPWLWYINFCKKLKLRDSVNQMLEALVCMHGDKPKTWKLAARWEFEENGCVRTAREFLIRGLRFLPYSTVLYKEALRLELEYADQARQRLPEAGYVYHGPSMENERAEIMMNNSLDIPEYQFHLIANCALAEVIYQVASKRIPEPDFIIQLLIIARAYKVTGRLQMMIVRDLCSRFPDSPSTWDAVARSELRGLRCFPEHLAEDKLPKNGQKNRRLFTWSLKERILRCIAVYSYAVKELGTKEMWSLYLETLMRLNRNEFSAPRLPKFKENLLYTAFVEAHNAGLVEEKYYLYWVRFSATGNQKRLGYVLRVASERLPCNIGLWQVRLGHCLSRGAEEEAISVFTQALVNLEKEIGSLLCLWTSVLEHSLTEARPIVEKLFLEGMKSFSPLAWHLKPVYLEWLATTKGINASRAAYETMCSDQPPFVQVHYTMAELEMARSPMNVEKARQCYEHACQEFGHNNPDVWALYAKLELMKGDLESTYAIQRRALEALNSSDSDEFISKYSYFRSILSTANDTSPMESTSN